MSPDQNNLLLQADSYKISHWRQLPPKTQRVYSYLESRGGFFEEVVFFGLQYYLHLLAGEVFKPEDISEAELFAEKHFGRKDCFNVKGWQRMYDKYHGVLPLRIKAVPEGTVVPVKNVLMTIENTDDEFPWLTNYMETILMKVWYPTTVCTLSREIKKVLKKFHIATGSELSGLPFKLHDFGYRGVSSEETAAIGGGAHLVNFLGTDTIAGIRWLRKYYQEPKEEMYGYSIPAAEHSTITSWGKENEYQAYKNMMDQWPEGLIAVVSDSYDLEYAITNLWGWRLRQQVMERQGTVVIRPDSGNPRVVVLKVLELLGEKFGTETNQKGYRVLCPKVRVIQGDGVNYYTIQDTLAAMQKAGWAAENVAFGMGGALLQQLNRDTQQFAIKCSSVTIEGQERDVWKETKEDPSKASKRGRLILTHDGTTYRTVTAQTGVQYTEDLLHTVFENGTIRHQYMEEIRKRAEV